MNTKTLSSASLAALFIGMAAPAYADCTRTDLDSRTEAVFYKTADCETTAFSLKVGKKKQSLGDDNDTISSVFVPKGAKVTMYSDSDYGASDVTLYPGRYPHLLHWNDAVSSVKVEAFDDTPLVRLLERNKSMADDRDQAVHYVALGTYNVDSGKKDQLLIMGKDHKAEISGVYVPKGYQVSLYSVFQGTKDATVLNGGKDGKMFDLVEEGINDSVKSLEVKRTGYKHSSTIVGKAIPAGDVQDVENVQQGQAVMCTNNSTAPLVCKGELKYVDTQSVQATTSEEVSLSQSLNISSTTTGSVTAAPGTSVSESLTVGIEVATSETFNTSDSKSKQKQTESSVSYEVTASPGDVLKVNLTAKKQPMTREVTYVFVNIDDTSDTYETEGTVKYDNLTEAQISVDNVAKNPALAEKHEPKSEQTQDITHLLERGNRSALYAGAMNNERDYDSVEDTTASQHGPDGKFHLLSAGHTLAKGFKHWSTSKNHYLVFVEGDLVVKDKNDKFVWSMRDQITKKGHVGKVVYQHDGNLAAYTADGTYLWSALHKAPAKNTELQLDDKGVLSIVQPNLEVLWTSAE